MGRWSICVVATAALGGGAILACGPGFTVKPVASDDRVTEGIRFYRPWPHLVVKQEFPVATSACFVSGTLAANGQYVEVDSTTLRFLNGGAWPAASSSEGGLAQLPVGALVSSSSLQAGKATVQPSGSGGSGKDGGAEGGSDGGGGAGADSGTAVSITSGTGTQPISLSDSLSLVYLPNEKESYVIQFTGSTQDAKLTLTSGWMLEGLNVQSQNVVANIVQNVLTSVLPSVEKLIPALQGGTTTLTTAAKTAAAPTPIVIKVHTVQYAVPGVYPAVHGTPSVTAESKAPVACDPKATLPTEVDVGIFKLQTRNEILLEVQSVGGTAAAGGGASSTPTTPSEESCASEVNNQFSPWASGHAPGVQITPQVQSVSSGKVVIAVTFGGNVTAATKASTLKTLGQVPLSVIQSSACSPNPSSVTVCEQGQGACKGSP